MLSRQQRTKSWTTGSVSLAGGQATPAWPGRTHIMGRVTYQQMAEHWPNASGEYADFMNKLPKVVFSKTLPAAVPARLAPGSNVQLSDNVSTNVGPARLERASAV